MKKRNYKFYVRRTHRYLGIFIGIQFLLWTLGGLYFSWTNIEEIRGEHLQNHHDHPNFNYQFVSPNVAIDEIVKLEPAAKIESVRAVRILNAPFWEMKVRENGIEKLVVADAIDGRIRPQISETEAKQIANSSLADPMEIKEAIFITKENVGKHHEYREKPLPAWAVTYENDLTIYLSAENGQIGAYRTTKWRIFDFLWMLHTMDFEGRDNLNNYVLRGFSILGIVTILSGFALFFVSSRFIRQVLFKR